MKLYASFFQYGEKIQMEHAKLYLENPHHSGMYNSHGGFPNQTFDSFADFIKFLHNYDIKDLCLSYGNITKEEPKQSDFINSILAEEKKDFPKNIEVTIERSNNPHGDYELTVCANDECLASYWYDTREEAQKDADKLEDFYEVTFI